MNGHVAERDTVARQNLERLAGELRGPGLSAELQNDRQGLPGLMVTELDASVLVLAGYATFWRQEPDGVVEQVGPFSDLAAAARAVREHLRDQQSADDIDKRARG